MTTTDLLIACLGIPEITILEAIHYFHIRLSSTAPILPDGVITFLLPNGTQHTLLLSTIQQLLRK